MKEIRHLFALASGLVLLSAPGGTSRTLLVHPDEFTDAWIGRARDIGLSALSFHPVGGNDATESLEGLLRQLDQPEFRARIDRAKARGLDVGYEMHAASWLLPRRLYGEHPEYFRMDGTGRRCPDKNLCFSNATAMDIAAKRAVELAGRLYGSTHRYFLWLDDVNGGGCLCANCRGYSESDQQLLFVNRVVTELRRTIPDARLCYLAYCGTVNPPEKVRPAPGVFLEYAAYRRDKKTPIARQSENQLEPLERLLDTFGRADARVLEYWFDNSLFSHYRKPPRRLQVDSGMVWNDIACYRGLGCEDLASFACYLGDDYERIWGPPDVSAFARGFYSAMGGRDETDFTWSASDGRFCFHFKVVDATPCAVDDVRTERDLERGDRVEVFFCPTDDMATRYYCLEMDPHGRVLDYCGVYPRRFDYGWGFRTLELSAAFTKDGYEVSGSLALTELKDLGIKPLDFWMGAFRADYEAEGRLAGWYSKTPPGFGEPDFHRPCMIFHCVTAELKQGKDCKLQ